MGHAASHAVIMLHPQSTTCLEPVQLKVKGWGHEVIILH